MAKFLTSQAIFFRQLFSVVYRFFLGAALIWTENNYFFPRKRQANECRVHHVALKFSIRKHSCRWSYDTFLVMFFQSAISVVGKCAVYQEAR